MKRILHVSGVKGPTMSGAERVLLDLIQCLSELGCESEVVVGGRGSFTSLLESEGIACVHLNVDALFPPSRNPAFAFKFLADWLSAARQMAREVKKRQIQLIVTHTRRGHWYGGLAGRLAGVPVVMYYHDLSHSRLSRLTKVLLALNATRVIAISNAVKQDLTAVPVVGKWVGRKVAVISNAVNLELFHPALDGRKVKTEFGLDTAFPIIGLVGQLSEWKGQLDLIKAAHTVARAFPAMKLLLIGDSILDNADYEKRLLELINTLGLDYQVIFTGHRNDIPECIAALDILVSASWAEPFGLVIIEAMACGKPVIGTYTGGAPEIIIEDKTGLLVPPHNADALSAAITKLASDRDTLKRMGQMGRRQVEDCFSIERWCARIHTFFTSEIPL